MMDCDDNDKAVLLDSNVNVSKDACVSEGEEIPAVSVDVCKDGEEIVADEDVLQEDSNDQHVGAEASNYQLESFRQQWQDELQKRPSSRSQSPRLSGKDEAKLNTDIEEQARSLFIQGMSAEDNGSLSLAIYYYKKALHLVPDIESKISAEYIRSPRDRVRQESESSIEGSELDEDLLQNLENLDLAEEGVCQPQYEQRATHISCLPSELLLCIMRWVVSSDLDFRSLEMFSMVCKGFYVFSRDEAIWKLACEKIWGINLGSTKKFGSSFRRMFIERPHLLYGGCYISKVTYVRQGEQGMDSFYSPYHLVEYYRYIRFFPSGQVLMLVSADDPMQSLPKLKSSKSTAAGLLNGHYKLSGNKVTCVLKRVRPAESSAYSRYKRLRQQANNDSEMTYCAEFDVLSSGRRSNAQLLWSNYTVRTFYKSSGTENVSDFVLKRESFPPLIFSRVKSYQSVSTEPLV